MGARKKKRIRNNGQTIKRMKDNAQKKINPSTPSFQKGTVTYIHLNFEN